jgi:transglutaminase-like putative cysteine protease
MLLHIQHETRYVYESPVNYSLQHLRLTPRQDLNQKTQDWQIIANGNNYLQIDGHGNIGHWLTLDQPRQDISIVVNGNVETTNQFCFEEPHPFTPFIYLMDTPLTHFNNEIQAFTQKNINNFKELDMLNALMAGIASYMRFESGTSHVHDTALQAFERQRGVCQDYAHLFVACCRSVGISSRYVSGYFFTGDDGHIASHAWADAWLAPYGWVSCDPTHQTFTNESYCRLAVGRDYLEACPVRGVRQGGGIECMHAHVNVTQQQ